MEQDINHHPSDLNTDIIVATSDNLNTTTNNITSKSDKYSEEVEMKSLDLSSVYVTVLDISNIPPRFCTENLDIVQVQYTNKVRNVENNKKTEEVYSNTKLPIIYDSLPVLEKMKTKLSCRESKSSRTKKKR